MGMRRLGQAAIGLCVIGFVLGVAANAAPHAANENWAVVNAGIGGNRVLRYGLGPSALARFDRDVLSVPGLKAIILLEGINDIGQGLGNTNSAKP
jgi:lysophospholipase L1-like esterase